MVKMSHYRKQVSSISAAVGLLALVGVTQAAPVVYFGTDPGATSLATMPNSQASALAFDTAAGLLGSVSNIDFESASLGGFGSGSLVLDLNTSISSNSSTGSIADVTDCTFNLCGGNTTPSGSHFAQGFGGDLVFSFVTPVNSFGAYFAGLQGNTVGQETIVYTSGGIQTVNIPNMSGGGAFVGFTDAGASIASITISFKPGSLGDIVSVDDVRYVMAVPEPETYAMFMAGLGLMGFIARRRKNGQS